MAGKQKLDEKALAQRVGTHVHRQRVAARITQEQLAEAAQITPEHVRALEGGTRLPSLRLLLQFSHLFTIDISAFFTPVTPRTPIRGRPRKDRDGIEAESLRVWTGGI